MHSGETATIFDVQRFSIHDGPGIRTVVFFKGCGMACIWCQNPEAMSPFPELAYYEDQCLDACTACLGSCPMEALRPVRAGRVDFCKCNFCGDCVDACPAGALRIVGREMTARGLLEEVEKDRSFYDSSGGGITLSGGEPVLHSLFLSEFLPLAKAQGLHVTLETAGSYPFGFLEPLLPYIDLIYFDVKFADPSRHRQWTSADNQKIVANLRQLIERDTPLQVRMPIVPGLNTDDQNIAETVALLRDLGLHDVTLLRYNQLWEAKLPRLATYRQPLGIQPPDERFYSDLSSCFDQAGFCAHL